MSIEDTLKERGATYGSYAKNVEARANIMTILDSHKQNCKGKPLSPFERIFIHDVVMKLVRLAGEPHHEDSAHDLAGYGLLIEALIKEHNNAS
jgi:hypothetical protein